MRAAQSTNTLAWRLARRRLPALVACERQVAGRGRHGRTWISEPGKSLTFSLAVSLRADALGGLSLTAALALASALRKLGYDAAVKWPNDVLDAAGRKLAGILVESNSRKQQAVLGAGINLRPQAQVAQVAQAGWLYAHSEPTERNLLLAKLALAMLDAIDAWRANGWSKLRAAWLKCSVHRPGAPLLVSHRGAAKRRMFFVDIGPYGELIACDASGRTHSIAAGEVTLDRAGH